ncbi:HigA family addiction module antitoxin [Roseicella sp. DB1501]|uniref:HigA family addiction module antitoxin n=1 Tax=Roseicella sp. DB1501 TaxID=2730925 RepID=UPI001492A482|nr:HigA family addiction module antitoxin [Roseicella sp. DB1501]NOG72268.1 HigA family addiction module antidote protein [Roseicella sp. DB1501]
MHSPQQGHPADAAPEHPGRLLRDCVLPGLGLSVSQAARELGIARSTLHRLLAGEQAVTPEMAARLARLSGVPARHWLARQQAHDLWHTERALAAVLGRIPTHALPRALQQEFRDVAHD